MQMAGGAMDPGLRRGGGYFLRQAALSDHCRASQGWLSRCLSS